MQSKVVLVAGASSGLGRAVAESLSRAGHIVYVGARSFAAGALPPAGCEALSLDVTDEKSVQSAVAHILAQQKRIDTLICCAATFTMAPLEELPIDTLGSMLQVNFLGMARCAQAVLPTMRQQGKGHIVLFSSLNGLFSIPFQGAYCATKHAVEAFGQALSQEVRPFGIHVTLVEPGDCQGGSQKYRQTHLSPASPYAAAFARGTSKIHHDENHGLPPQRVGKAVCRAVSRRHPPARMIVAALDQRAAVWLNRFLPRKLFDQILTRYYG